MHKGGQGQLVELISLKYNSIQVAEILDQVFGMVCYNLKQINVFKLMLNLPSVWPKCLI